MIFDFFNIVIVIIIIICSIMPIATKSMNVIVTGGSRGLGRALVNELVMRGHNVIHTTRAAAPVPALMETTAEDGRCSRLLSVQCDVSRPRDVAALFQTALEFYKGAPVHAIINNAAASGGYGSLLETLDDTLMKTVNTNLLGTLLCCKYGRQVFREQSVAGHMFIVVGAGSDGSATPFFAPYGSTKAAVMQLTRTLQNEERKLQQRVLTHTLSPGMMPTPLLLDNLPDHVASAVKLFCAHPKDVAQWSIDQVTRIVCASPHNDKQEHLQYFSPARALWLLGTNLIKS